MLLLRHRSNRDQEQTYHVDGTDTEYISGLSTLLAATIQETKESVSQIEYLFCKQLFPDFQSKLKKIYTEAKKAAEDEWKKKEFDLTVRIQTLESEKQKIFEENQFLKTESSKMKKIPNDLEEELKRKTKEIAEKRELQKSLRELLDSKAKTVNGNETKMKEIEEENNNLKLNLESKCRIIIEKEESNCELLQLVKSKNSLIEQKERQIQYKDDKLTELSEKLELSERKFEEKKAFQETLLIKMRTQAAEVLKTKQLLDDCETKNKVLTDQLRQQQQLIEQNGRELEEVEKEKRLFVAKVKSLEDEVEELQVEVKERNKDSTEGMELHGKLLQQIEGKNNEIMIEKNKRREVIDAYKKLKSQYNYLCSKSGLTSENMHGSSSTKVNKDQLIPDQNMLNSPVMDGKSPSSPMPASETTSPNVNQQDPNDKTETRTIHGSSSSSPFVAQPDSSKKANLLSGTKRPISHWRDTRPTKNRNGPDPHDDFLDTPLENIKEDLKKGVKEEAIHQLPGPAPKDMNFESSDDETQDLNADMGPQRPEKKSFKYVEPVRKKAERANLKGVECKQCRKFYDAVLPADGNDNNNKRDLRCEHHEGVSRHRYRFAPPSTPEGFWNIGFESEM
ncbi:putative DNA endonuclease Ctp1, DNA endonuclease RBBP8 [Helianthus annuus]|nr:putative DNA endonuclease Ctp1, DNA endonuclease RBBP8 [Helianthus annuus]